MKNQVRSHWKIVLIGAIILILFSTTTVLAQESGESPVAVIQVDKDSVTWMPQVKHEGLLLTVSGPGDFYWQDLFEVGEIPTFSTDSVRAPLEDGTFRYELLVLSTLEYKTRDGEVDTIEGSLSEAQIQTGAFSVIDSKFVGEVLSEASSNDQDGGPALLDQQILDDLIVTGSGCFGFDCVNGESFGFDTVRLKENNLRIHFQDTSTSASFPSRDWRIVINDSANGGANYFAIQDADSSRNVFLIEGGAPANSLYVEDYGRVGLGTNTPVVELHIKDGDTPSVRLEQDGSYGWSPQTWDVAGNESNFFIRDATNGSKLSFRIQPGTPSNTLALKSEGKVGMGTWSPVAKLEIEGTNWTDPFLIVEDTAQPNPHFYIGGNGNVGIGTATPSYLLDLIETDNVIAFQVTGGGGGLPMARFKRDGQSYVDIAAGAGDPQLLFDVQNSATQWSVGADNSDGDKLKIGYGGYVSDATHAMAINTSGNVAIGTTFTPGAKLTVDGTISELSDANAKTNFLTVDGKEILANLVEMPISTWSYINDDSETIHMGPTAQDFSQAFGLGGSYTSIATVDRDGVALAAIQGLNEIVMEKDAQIVDLEARLDALEANGTPQSQLSLMVILPWVLLTLALIVLAFTFGKLQALKVTNK